MSWAGLDVKVTWDGEDDPNDPYNWSQAFRLLTTLSLSCGGLVNTMSTSIVAPSLPQISKDLHIGTFTTQLTMSVYLLAYVFAPFIIAPFSEMYGRRPAYLICHAFYILFNSLCPVGKSKSVMIACRFLSGLGGACGITVSPLNSLPLNTDVDDRYHLAVWPFDGRYLAN